MEKMYEGKIEKEKTIADRVIDVLCFIGSLVALYVWMIILLSL